MTDKNNVITINGTEYNEDTLTDEQKYAINQIKDLQSKYEKDKFVDYYLSNGGVSANWEAAFRNWIRRAYEYGRKGEARGSGHAATSTKDVSDRRSRILRVAKSGDSKSDGNIKRFPTRKRD